MHFKVTLTSAHSTTVDRRPRPDKVKSPKSTQPHYSSTSAPHGPWHSEESGYPAYHIRANLKPFIDTRFINVRHQDQPSRCRYAVQADLPNPLINPVSGKPSPTTICFVLFRVVIKIPYSPTKRVSHTGSVVFMIVTNAHWCTVAFVNACYDLLSSLVNV